MKLFLFGMLLVLVSCTPSVTPTEAPVPTISIDTTNVIELDTTEETAPDSAVITITPNGVKINSTTIVTDYTADVHTFTIKLNEFTQPTSITANDAVLLKEATPIGTGYTYMDNNTIIVQRGNNLNAIINDHKRMGYNISTKSVLKCNPFLNKRGRQLQVGDILKLTCNDR